MTMKKLLATIPFISLPLFAAWQGGCIDLDGSKAAEKAAILAQWDTETRKPAPVGVVTVGEIEVITAPSAPIAQSKPARKAVAMAERICRTEALKSGGSVQFCGSADYVASLGGGAW
jgi:hypothetical protein